MVNISSLIHFENIHVKTHMLFKLTPKIFNFLPDKKYHNYFFTWCLNNCKMFVLALTKEPTLTFNFIR